MINVARAELAADAERGVFLHRAGIVTGGETEHRCIVATSNGDGHGLRRRSSVSRAAVVGGDHGVREGDGFTRAEEIGVLAGAVVPTVVIDRETGDQCRSHARIERAAAPGDVAVGGVRHSHHVDVVHIGKAQCTAVAQCGRTVAFAHGAGGVGNRQRRPVVGAGDGNGHGLYRAVADRHVIGLGEGLAFAQELHGGVVYREVPAQRTATGAGAVVQWICGEAAQVAGSARCDGDAMGVDQVGVGEGDAAVGGVVATVFLGIAGLHAAGDVHLVVGAGEGDDHILRCRRTMPIVEGDHIGFGSRLTLGQVLGCRIVHGVSPVNGAVGRIGRFNDRGKAEVAQRCGIASRRHE